MKTSRRNAPDKARKTRPAGTGRALECQLGGDSKIDTTIAFRLQRLATRYGIPAERSALIAGLAWGEVHHG